jgi:hypothetical protein
MTGRFQLLQGDVLDVLPALEPCSFDACLCDPPYGLEFMGQEWDRGIPPTEVWRSVYRVLKPGAFLLAFGGTRTHHRLMCAIEDAGFEIRDCLMWLYGCLSEDTEVLVNGQWVPYHKATAGNLALCYNVSTNEFSWQPIRELVTYDYDDTAYRIQSDSTDQIVSRNHRCIVERGGAQVFQFAEEAAREPEIRVPILEDLRGLLEALPLPYTGASDAQQNLPRLPTSDYSEAETYRQTQGEAGSLCGLPEACPEAAGVAQTDQDPDVLAEVQRRTTGRGMGQARAQGARGLDAEGGAVLPREDERREQPGVEGRRDLLPQARELQADQVCAVSEGIPEHGAEGWLCDGTPANCGAVDRPSIEAGGSGSPRYARPTEQQPRDVDAVSEQSGAQTVRGSRFTRSDLARISALHYRGVVWCVRVPTGAFVARRNGKVFVTGNSGFPKSLDISKALDKAAGSERTVVGIKPGHEDFVNRTDAHAAGGRADGWNRAWKDNPEAVRNSHMLTAPATESAQRFSGYGTALKPAWEPIIVAMKPCDGTFAENALKWGVAGLNIDGGRIPVEDADYARNCSGDRGYADNRTRGAGFAMGGGSANDSGRWPANVILDEESAAMLDEQTGELTSGANPTRRGSDKFRGVYSAFAGQRGCIAHRGKDTGGASRFFYCAKPSRRERGEYNTHPTVKPVTLTEYLAKLLLPPERETPRRIVVPFSGSGSEIIGALNAGWDEAVGIEREQKWSDIATRRIQEQMPALFAEACAT